MRKMIVKEFTDKSNIEIILEFMKINHGYITLKQIADFFWLFFVLEKRKSVKNVVCYI